MNVSERIPLRILPSKVSERADTNVYRPFFLFGMLTVLTAGCLLGAIALLGISMSKSYTVLSWAPYIKAHANSQLFGWVGFFVMGFAMQQHAPSIATTRSFHRLAWLALGLMATGIVLRFLAEPLIRVDYAPWYSIGILSGVLQATAVVLFIYNVSVNKQRTGQPLTWQTTFVFASLFWLLVVAIAEPIAFALSHTQEAQANILFTAKWMPPLRDAQFLGFVAMMIFGVSLTKLNSCFGAKPAYESLARFAFLLWNLSLIVKMAGWLYAFEAGMTLQSRTIEFAACLGLGTAAILLIASSRTFEAFAESYRSHKFVRAAYFWLGVASIMLILEPLHLAATGNAFSHAYLGAIRHAVTVGFISQMILGFGMHVVARMNDLDERKLPQLWSVFILLNLGNAMRVGFEVMTDYTPTAFMPMGMTGFIELTALAIWAAHVSRPLLSAGIRRAFSVS